MASIINATTTGITVTGDNSGQLTLSANGVTALTANTTGYLNFAKQPTIGGVQWPAFSAYANASQSISSVTYTKITFNAEEFDTASCFDSTTNYRFTPTVAGYYQVNLVMQSNGNNSHWAIIYKNGSAFKYGAPNAAGVNVGFGASLSALIYMNGTTDYIEWFVYLDATSTRNIQNDADQITTGVWIRS